MSYRLPALNALRAFEAAARHLSFKQAASELCVTPTAVSHQIKLLEDYLGVALFRRLTRALELTPQGEAMLPKVREGMECFAAAVECARERVARGRLVVVVPPFFATRWLVPRLRHFTEANPSVNLQVIRSNVTVDSEQANAASMLDSVDMREDDSVVMIRFGTGSYPGFHVQRMFGSDYIAVCSPALLANGPPLREPADMRNQTRLHDDGIAMERLGWDEWFKLAGVSGVDSAAGPHFSDSGLVYVAALDGLGVALASRPLVASAIAQGRLVAPFELAIAQHYAYYVVTPQAMAERAAVLAFRNWLMQEASSDMLPGVA